MADINWETLFALIPQPQKNSLLAYQFLQLMRLCETATNAEKFSTTLHLSAAATLEFPATDFRYTDNALQLSFMGLSGSDSPLPHYFLVELAKQPILKSFVDIFNQQIYHLLYAAWKKFHPEIFSNYPIYLKYLGAISGNSLTAIDKTEFSYAGILGSHVHSTVSIANSLSEFILAPVHVEEFVLQHIPLPLSQLGTVNCQLNENLSLGNPLDLNKIRLHMGPVTLEKLLTLLPQTQLAKELNRLVSHFVSPFLTYDYLFHLEANVAVPLGTSTLFLGWTCWLGEAKQNLQLPVIGTKFRG